MYESVVFVSRFVIQELPPSHNIIVISLTSPNDPARIAIGWRDVLRLEFHDVCEEVFGVTAGSIPDEQEHYTHEFGAPNYGMALFRLPTSVHAKAIMDFLARNEGGCCDFVDVIVHCDQGKSRSAAVAQFVANRYDVPILNTDPAWQDRVSMLDTSRANPRLLRLLAKQRQG